MKRFEMTEPVVNSDIHGSDYVGVHIKDNVFKTEADLNLETNIEQGKVSISINRVDLNAVTVDQSDVIASLKDMLRFVMFGDNNKELNDNIDDNSKDRTTYWPKARYINNGGTISELFTRHGFVNVKAAEEQIFEWKKEFGFDICEAWIDVCGKNERKNEYRSYCSKQNRIEVIRRYPNDNR